MSAPRTQQIYGYGTPRVSTPKNIKEEIRIYKISSKRLGQTAAQTVIEKFVNEISKNPHVQLTGDNVIRFKRRLEPTFKRLAQGYGLTLKRRPS